MTASAYLDRARRELAQARADLMVAVGAQPRHRLLDGLPDGLPECPRVLAAHDRVEVWTAAVAEIERRVKMAGELV